MHNGNHVLVVDDDAPIAASLRRALEYAGHRVTVAADGPGALAAAARECPDVVVLDVMLPGLDGLAVCRRLREQAHDVLILMLTARDAPPDRAAGTFLRRSNARTRASSSSYANGLTR